MVKAQKQFELLKVELPKKKLKWAEVSLSDVLQRGKRIEGSYFNIEGKKARQAIRNCGFDVLSVVGYNGFANKAYHRPRFKRIFVKKGIPIYMSFQCLELFPKPLKYVSKLTRTNLDLLYLKKDQILLTCSGTIGHVSYVGKTLADKLFSHDLIRIEVQNRSDRGFLYAFLRSKPGFFAVTTNIYGSVVTHIEPEHLEHVPVPNPPEKIKESIAEKVLKAVDLRDEANELLQKAEDIFYVRLNLKRLSELKPKYLNKAKSKVFNIKLSGLDKRIDGSFHNPVAFEIIKQLKKAEVELTTCGDPKVSKNIFLPGRFKRYYVDENYGIPFLSGRNIFQIYPITEAYLSKQKHAKQLDQLMVREGIILITRSGTIGKVQLAPKYFDSFSATEDIIRMIPSSPEIAGFIFCFLNSDYGSQLLKKICFGSVILHLDEKRIADAPFPLPKDNKITKEINDIVLEANERRNEAWNLEKEAVVEVETLISM